MSGKSIRVLAIVTGVLVAAAAVATYLNRPSQPTTIPDRILPGLQDRINEVSTIIVEGGDASTRVSRSGGTWGIEERDGYPARPESVRQLLLGMAELEPVEPKTSNPDLYERIGVNEPGPGDETVKVTLFDDGGNDLGTIIVGDWAPGAAGSARYVRTGKSAQAWLASGRVNVVADPNGWLDREIFRMERDRVQRIQIAHEGAETINISRDGGATTFSIENLPDGRELHPSGPLNRVVGAVSYVDLQNVRAARDDHPDAAAPVVTTFTTDDGLEVSIRSWKEGETFWATFDARKASDPDEQGAESGETAQAHATDPDATVASEIADLDARLGPWEFELSPSKAQPLRMTMDEMTQPIPNASGEEAEQGPEAPSGP